MEKQEILDEIERNDGKPLGSLRFENETDIRQADWYGVHWANWGEALVEAGYEPNSFNKGYDQEWLIESFISVIHEVGEWPSQGRLKIICRNREDLPSADTFRKRLGNKPEMAAKIVAYCQQQSGYEGVISICEPHTRLHEIAEEKDSNDETIGFVYLMKSGKYHKIEHSNTVGRREYELGTKLPEKLETIHTIETDDPKGIERYWHERFKDKRKEGEWFDLNTSDIALLRTY